MKTSSAQQNIFETPSGNRMK